MQPNAAKLALIHKTPFSVEDILDPMKFTRKTICADAAEAATGASECVCLFSPKEADEV